MSLEYLKNSCCPKCGGTEVVKKTLTYLGCPNDDHSQVVMDGKNRFWYKFFKPSELSGGSNYQQYKDGVPVGDSVNGKA